MTVASDQKEFEDLLGKSRQHTNKQTFSAATAPMFEIIDTPGVDIAGRMACLIMAVQVIVNFGSALNAGLKEWRTMIMGGEQGDFLTPDNPKYIAEHRIFAPIVTSGVSRHDFPLTFDNPTKPMLVVNPHITIGHMANNSPDFANEDVYTMFSYMVVPMTVEMHTSLLHAQMDLT